MLKKFGSGMSYSAVGHAFKVYESTMYTKLGMFKDAYG